MTDGDDGARGRTWDKSAPRRQYRAAANFRCKSHPSYTVLRSHVRLVRAGQRRWMSGSGQASSCFRQFRDVRFNALQVHSMSVDVVERGLKIQVIGASWPAEDLSLSLRSGRA
jgi:hypothetical protein